MTVTDVARHAGLLIWVAYFAVPADVGGIVDGMPVGPVEASALLALAWLAARNQAPRYGWLVGAILTVSVIGAAAIPGAGGFRARYFANAEAAGPHERSTEFGDAGFTRIDRQLDFAPGGPELPLAFFNDPARFNFHDPAGLRRRQLEFAAAWNGQWLTGGGTYSLYLDAPGATAELFVDGERVIAVTPDSGAIEVATPLAAGWHRLDVTFSSPYGAPRRFSVGERRDGAPRPFDSASIFTERVRPWQATAARALRVAKITSDAAILAWLAWLVVTSIGRHLAGVVRGRSWRWRREIFPMLAVVAAVEALVFAWPWSRLMIVMAGGDDPMTYEWYARDILLNGILMNGGLPLGAGEPFYYQAFYPYFLAAIHAVFGEGMFGVLLMQRLLVALTVWMIVRIAIAIGGEDVWPWALACGLVFAIGKFWPIAAELLNESLYVPLLVTWAALAVRACGASSLGRAAVSGAAAGVTALTRSTALLAWPAVFAVCWYSWRVSGRHRPLLAAMVLSAAAVFSLIAIRNGIVARDFALTSTVGVTLLGGNEPPPGVVINLDRRGALYDWLGVGTDTAQVIEFALAAPAAFARLLAKKALFALGFYEPYAPGWGYSPIYIAGWLGAAAGLVIAVRAGHLPPAVVAIPALVAMSQLLAVVLVYPKGERLILPIYSLLVPYAGVFVAWVVRLLTGRSPVQPTRV